MKSKKICIVIIVIIALILLIPIPMRLKDGGSVRFQALLYSVTKYHQLNHQVENGYIDGIGIEILGMEIINTADKKVETHTITEERIKLADLKIEAEGVDITKLVKFNGNIYAKSFALLDYAGELMNNSIGKINFLIEKEYFPQLDGETNCEELLGATVLEADDKSMILNVNNVAVLFYAIDKNNIKKANGELLFEKCGEEENNTQTYNSFVGTVLEETTTYMIVEPNEDEAERKSADKIRINYGVAHRDYVYGIGRKVIIQYTGYIKETYPAQIDTDNILTDGYKEFEISVKKSENKTKTKILNNMELYKNNSDYDLYYYGLDEVNIFVDNKTMSLEDALRSGKMTIEGILAKANKDVSDGKIKNDKYYDGGTTEWYYSDYTILKRHTLRGDGDVYILRNDITNRDI